MCNNPLLVEIKHRDIGLRVFKYLKKEEEEEWFQRVFMKQTKKRRRNISKNS